ncbi:MAG: tRNA preQ1(34) S-adenosylmethionine ribosyltransferase-isomerase QueA [Planctomycetia bacterium]|nr:MAG: tRNA preQ1(34) S-adenosylmethionine ribosyltransferase-isomerase QueA [Planctomycetia bacterium]
MLTIELDYDLPPERIAQQPVAPRDASRLLVLDRAAGTTEHAVFRDVGRWLRAGDLLVLNDTRVVPARFFAQRDSGGRVEGLYLHGAPQEGAGHWCALLKPAARLREGESLKLDAAADVRLVAVRRLERGTWLVRTEPPTDVLPLLARIGSVPLPPYIRRGATQPDAVANAQAGGAEDSDRERYQTVYAERAGAVAAPTAGLHFTPELLSSIRAAGVALCTVTLHVGVGTFAPIVVDDLREHPMHAEWFEACSETIAALRRTRAAGGRVIAVGTTSARVLETLAQRIESAELADAGPPAPVTGWTDIFLYPPLRLIATDALITNFHLPRSTLLAMVMALAGVETIRRAYAEAIREQYRFYSYGDAMLIL